MDKELITKIYKNEHSYLRMFCDVIIKDNYIRYCDDKLKDMYDHNFVELFTELTPKLLYELEEYKEIRKESHFKIFTYEPIEWLIDEDFDIGCTLVMVATELKVNPPKIDNIKFLNTKNNPEIINDILFLELKYYGDLYGNDFGSRSIYRHYLEMVNRDNYYYLACYYNDINIGQCYVFYSDGVVVIDGLIVEEKYRHLNIASNLILQAKNTFNCPIYLHAYELEDAKDMYTKIGFKTVYKEYDHLRLDKDK